MKKAFTLVEMLIVIVIIGILAAALIPKLTGVQGRARDVASRADLQQQSTALSTYYLDNGSYIVSGAAATWANNDTVLMDLVSNNLMKSLPKSTTTIPYQYITSNSGTVFGLKALAETESNANYGQTASVTNFITGGTNSTSVVNAKLCTKVTKGTENVTNPAACVLDIDGKNARYILAN